MKGPKRFQDKKVKLVGDIIEIPGHKQKRRHFHYKVLLIGSQKGDIIGIDDNSIEPH